MILKSIIYNPKDENGEPQGGIEYVFSDGATEWEQEAVREYGAQSKDEVEDALAWREAMDALESDNPKLARVMRGKHPTKDKDIARPNPRRGPPQR